MAGRVTVSQSQRWNKNRLGGGRQARRRRPARSWESSSTSCWRSVTVATSMAFTVPQPHRHRIVPTRHPRPPNLSCLPPRSTRKCRPSGSFRRCAIAVSFRMVRRHRPSFRRNGSPDRCPSRGGSSTGAPTVVCCKENARRIPLVICYRLHRIWSFDRP